MKLKDILKYLNPRTIIENEIAIGEKYLHFQNCFDIAIEKININLTEYEYFILYV